VKQLPLKREGSNFKKRSGFLKGERGRQAIVYMKGVLIVGLVSFQVICFV